MAFFRIRPAEPPSSKDTSSISLFMRWIPRPCVNAQHLEITQLKGVCFT
jgi:hypothetical protein